MIVCWCVTCKVNSCDRRFDTPQEHHDFQYRKDVERFSAEGDRVLAYGKETLISGCDSNSRVQDK